MMDNYGYAGVVQMLVFAVIVAAVMSYFRWRKH
jgi:hypothetical protein